MSYKFLHEMGIQWRVLFIRRMLPYEPAIVVLRYLYDGMLLKAQALRDASMLDKRLKNNFPKNRFNLR
jgi:hypothetical protein